MDPFEMYYELTVIADTNDADYITEITKITQTEFNQEVLPVVEAINQFNHDNRTNWNNPNWPSSNIWYDRGITLETQYPDMFDAVDLFDEKYCPHGEEGVHTIDEILVKPWIESLCMLATRERVR